MSDTSISSIVSALRQNGWGTQEELHAPPPPTWTPEAGKVGNIISSWNDGRAGKKAPVSVDPNVAKHLATWTDFVASQKQPNKPTGPSIAGVVAKLRSNGWGTTKDFKRRNAPPTTGGDSNNTVMDEISAVCKEGRVSIAVTRSSGSEDRSEDSPDEEASTRCSISISIDGEEAVRLSKQ